MKTKKYTQLSILLVLALIIGSSYSVYIAPRAKADVTLSGNLSGTYDYSGQDVNIGNVNVSNYDGSSGGNFVVYGNNITVTGTINASGAGYGGGGGGGGGAGGVGYSGGIGGAAGAGIAGGNSGVAGANLWYEGLGVGGRGGAGGGSYGGAYGTGGTAVNYGYSDYGRPGSLGGYAGTGVNGDTSTDENVSMGSGGGGGGGASSGRSDSDCNWSVGGGGGGGGAAGNRGGGYVKLIASGTLTISGTINAKGLISSAGNGSNGAAGQRSYSSNGGAGGAANASGSSSPGSGGARSSDCRGNFRWGSCDCEWIGGQTQPGGAGGTGGAGAGGGIVLRGSTVNFSSGSIDNRGGGNNYTNGGTLKILYSSSYTLGSYAVGRLFTKSFNNAPTATIDTPTGATTINFGESVDFTGHGTDTDGTVVNYEWWDGGCGSGTSLNSGTFAFSPTAAYSNNSFSSTSVHNVYFRVQDNLGSWSTCDMRQITVRPVCNPLTPPAEAAFCSGDTTNLPGSSNIAITEVAGDLSNPDANCTVQKCEYHYNVVPGTCDSDMVSQTFCNEPTGDLCSSGTASSVSESSDGNYWEWTCSGRHGGSDESCQALKSCAWREVAPN